ncbi:MAG: hypothetical protein FWG64_13315 [Firmicutes bacterium]|nr:hypothetical protein [Bacillota bacterium]
MINKALLKEQLKRFWIFSAFFMLMYILSGILPLHINNWQDAQFQQLNQLRMLIGIFEMRHPLLVIFTVFTPFVAINALYPHYASTRAATAFYSFPISKRGLFCTNFVAALILTLTPLLAFCVILLLPPISYSGPIVMSENWTETILFNPQIFPHFAQGNFGVINSVSAVAAFFARTAIGIIFYLGLFLMAISLSGNGYVRILFCGALPLVPLGVHTFVNLIGDAFVFGFDSGTAALRVLTVGTFTNPVLLSEYLNPTMIISENIQLWQIYLVYTVIIVITLAFSYIFGNLRKIENVGESVISSKFKKVCVFLFSFGGAILLAIILGESFSSMTMLYFGAILGFLLAYVVAQMIAEQQFSIAEKLKFLPHYAEQCWRLRRLFGRL